ncbi:hypothetical protein TL16_g05302 [Triparma laevis f. inornata]|uniref:Uncharacterized protein n=2 Tax=Triparma laevis TaxID=1534972 RepID=A0A9W6ZD30_9STRA|nr:hypothetical protein TrLO_g7454 [Triparma laevis f. longispina]GMH70014.1 hypothetical protein TL16_g05302 [Triparma laevis f. inornata]
MPSTPNTTTSASSKKKRGKDNSRRHSAQGESELTNVEDTPSDIKEQKFTNWVKIVDFEEQIKPTYYLCGGDDDTDIPLRLKGGVPGTDDDTDFHNLFDVALTPDLFPDQIPSTTTGWKNFLLPYPDFIGSHIYKYEMVDGDHYTKYSGLQQTPA